MELWSELGVATKSEFDQAVVDETIGISSAVLVALEERQRQLLQLRESRTNEIRTLATQIAALWARFNVPVQQRERFFANHEGLGPEVVAAVRLLPSLRSFVGTSLICINSAKQNSQGYRKS